MFHQSLLGSPDSDSDSDEDQAVQMSGICFGYIAFDLFSFNVSNQDQA